MEITSPAFEAEGEIPRRHSAEGDNIPPALEWTDPPTGTAAFALVMDDPDAPQPVPWVHWIVHNIPPDVSGFGEGGADAGIEATNSLGNKRYDGPMPPLGHGVHRYRFIIYALDSRLRLDQSAVRNDLANEMEGHILDSAELGGTYERPLLNRKTRKK